ncbi:hypothetical protein BC828DRAFT_193509 [Blastocladiella britannica]|nr:hypothetical protein BC828DRAFT_193509 [Blastocladiella britannica]
MSWNRNGQSGRRSLHDATTPPRFSHDPTNKRRRIDLDPSSPTITNGRAVAPLSAMVHALAPTVTNSTVAPTVPPPPGSRALGASRASLVGPLFRPAALHGPGGGGSSDREDDEDPVQGSSPIPAVHEVIRSGLAVSGGSGRGHQRARAQRRKPMQLQVPVNVGSSSLMVTPLPPPLACPPSAQMVQGGDESPLLPMPPPPLFRVIPTAVEPLFWYHGTGYHDADDDDEDDDDDDDVLVSSQQQPTPPTLPLRSRRRTMHERMRLESAGAAIDSDEYDDHDVDDPFAFDDGGFAGSPAAATAMDDVLAPRLSFLPSHHLRTPLPLPPSVRAANDEQQQRSEVDPADDLFIVSSSAAAALDSPVVAAAAAASTRRLASSPAVPEHVPPRFSMVQRSPGAASTAAGSARPSLPIGPPAPGPTLSRLRWLTDHSKTPSPAMIAAGPWIMQVHSARNHAREGHHILDGTVTRVGSVSPSAAAGTMVLPSPPFPMHFIVRPRTQLMAHGDQRVDMAWEHIRGATAVGGGNRNASSTNSSSRLPLSSSSIPSSSATTTSGPPVPHQYHHRLTPPPPPPPSPVAIVEISECVGWFLDRSSSLGGTSGSSGPVLCGLGVGYRWAGRVHPQTTLPRPGRTGTPPSLARDISK